MATKIANVLKRAAHGCGHATTRDIPVWWRDLDAAISGVQCATDPVSAMQVYGWKGIPSHALKACKETAGVLFTAPDELEGDVALAVAIDWLRVMHELRAHVESAEFRAAAEVADKEQAARKPDGSFAWADDIAEYYGGGSID